jgi:adhesin transport system outer membrane protein
MLKTLLVPMPKRLKFCALAIMLAAWPDVSSAQLLETPAPAAAGVDLGLLSAITSAAETHPTIMAAQASARAAGADVSAAKWKRFPSVAVEGLLLDQPGIGFQAQALVDQPLWTGGRIAGSINFATAQENAALAAYDEAVLAIAVSTATAFYEGHRWREQAAILSDSLNEHNRMVATMERRYAQEVSPRSDLELARARALQIEQLLLQVQAQERVALNRLAVLTGDPYFLLGPTPQAPGSWPIFDDDDLITSSLSYSPTLRRFRFEAQGASAEADVAEASVLPQLSVQYSYSEFFGHRVGLVLKAQTDGGLSNLSSAEAARERRAAADMQIMSGERQLRDEVNAVLQEYRSATLRLQGSLSASSSAQEVMASYMRQFTDGRRTWLDVMNALREATSAQINVIDTRMAAKSSLARLLLLSGQLMGASGLISE